IATADLVTTEVPAVARRVHADRCREPRRRVPSGESIERAVTCWHCPDGLWSIEDRIAIEQLDCIDSYFDQLAPGNTITHITHHLLRQPRGSTPRRPLGCMPRPEGIGF